MTLGWECSSKHVKQLSTIPTQSRKPILKQKSPGPNQYDTPPIFGGNGFSKIKRAPAYTMGIKLHLLPVSTTAAKPYAPLLNVRGFGRKGSMKVTHGIISARVEPPRCLTRTPGPAAYVPPRNAYSHKQPPAYSIRMSAKPPYTAWDQWTPPANMYWPYIPYKSSPAYSLGAAARRPLRSQKIPGPGDHLPYIDYLKKNNPSFSFAGPYYNKKPSESPAPNAYCEKKFMVSKPFRPAPSFGIRHSPYRGKPEVFLKTSKLDLVVAGD